MAEIQEKSPTQGTIQHINPDGLPRNPAFTQAVAVSGSVKTVYVGAQTPVDASGALVGKGDVAAQTEQVLKNVQICLEAAGARPEHVIQWNIYVVQDQPIQPGFEAGMRWWGDRPNPPANTVLLVAGFPLLPDVLVMIDAIAVVPEEN
jgi:enamine deaminase RidA (YjgF/YER057c/UK114 family)